jgi:hypothetical protein
MNARLLLLVLLAASLPALASTQVYSWTDANGVKHFTDSPPPPSVNAQKLKVRGSVTSEDQTPPAPAPAQADAAKANGPTPAAIQPIARSLADSPENRQRQCQTSKKNLDILQGSYPVSGPPGADGKAQVMDDAARKQATDRAAEQVKFYCR